MGGLLPKEEHHYHHYVIQAPSQDRREGSSTTYTSRRPQVIGHPVGMRQTGSGMPGLGPTFNNRHMAGSKQMAGDRQAEQNANKPSDEAKELQALVKQFQKNIEKAKEYGRIAQDPDRYEQFKKKSLDIYLARLPEVCQQQLKKVKGKQTQLLVKIVVGKVSSGKSSLLNKLLGLSLDVGAGQTTLEPAPVFKNQKVVICDTPGQNQDFNTSNIDNIRYILQADEIYILFPDSLKNAEQLVRVICTIKPDHTVVIRTKCDMAEKGHSKTLEEQLDTDRAILAGWGFPKIRVIPTSAKTACPGNEEVKKMLLG